MISAINPNCINNLFHFQIAYIQFLEFINSVL